MDDNMTSVATQLSDDWLLALADTYHTPLYVFEEAVIRSRCREIKTAITYPNTHVRYACKALTLQAVLKIMKNEGLWIDASSINEFRRARLAGFAANEIFYTGEGASESVYAELVAEGAGINCASIDQIKLLGRVDGSSVCSLRINPGEGHGASNKTNTGGPSSKHGIYRDQIEEAKSVARQAGLKIAGIHTHIGSGGDSIEEWLRIKDITLDLAASFEDLTFVNLGGGLPVVYNAATEWPINLTDWGAELTKSMAALSNRLQRSIELQIEPGRYLVAHSGTLLATVQAVKRTPKYRFVVVNTGLNHNIRPAMYGSFHPMRFVARDRPVSDKVSGYVVAGYLCESGDVFTVSGDGSSTLAPRPFPEMEVGDLMVMGCVGAYSHAMKSDYNSMNLPASVLVGSDGSARVIERRGTLDDVMRRELDALEHCERARSLVLISARVELDPAHLEPGAG
jgi:diaminopimelate decarboxylase